MQIHLVAAVIGAVLIAPAQDVDAVLARYVDALGGREALERLPSRTLTGVEIDDQPYRGPVRTEPVVLRFPDDVGHDPKLALLLDPQSALHIKELFPGLHGAGLQQVNGLLHHVLESDLDPAYYSLAFDAETGLLTRLGYYWTLSDYRVVDGVQVPFRVHRSRKGGSTVWEFETVDHQAR